MIIHDVSKNPISSDIENTLLLYEALFKTSKKLSLILLFRATLIRQCAHSKYILINIVDSNERYDKQTS